MEQAVVHINNVSFAYPASQEEQHSRWALKNINLEVNSGEIVALLGHNGSGKSTLAKLVNGLLLPTEGEVRVMGKDTRNEEELWEIRRLVGMVFQNPDNGIVGATVEEDVAFGLENLGLSREQIRERLDWALGVVGLEHLRDSEPHRLSGGQKQRLVLAGVLAVQPKVIIMDEATAMLDPVGRKEVLDAVRKLNREQGLSVLMVTHHMQEAALADRVVLIESGQISRIGSPSEVLTAIEELYQLHLDAPLAAEVAHHLRQAGHPLPEGILEIDQLVEELWKLWSNP